MINPDDLGVDVKTGVAGLFGGLFALLVMRELSAKQAFVSVAGGFFTATYCTNLMIHIMDIPRDFAGGVGFAIGLFGMAVVGKLLVIIQTLTFDDLKDLSLQWIKTIGSQIIEGIKSMKRGDK